MSVYGERELDVRVAEALGQFLWVKWPNEKCRSLYRMQDLDQSVRHVEHQKEAPLTNRWDRYLPHYSTDPDAYIGLLEEVRGRGFGWRIDSSQPIEGEASTDWRMVEVFKEMPDGVKDERFSVASSDLGEAVCLAVLAAMEGGAK